jgi:hypothetical protein
MDSYALLSSAMRGGSPDDVYPALLQLSDLLEDGTRETAAHVFSAWPEGGSPHRELQALLRSLPACGEAHFLAARCYGLLMRARCPPLALRGLLRTHRALARAGAAGGAAAVAGALEAALGEGGGAAGAAASCASFWSLPGGVGGGTGCLALPGVGRWPFERSLAVLAPFRVAEFRKGAETLLRATSSAGAEFSVWAESEVLCFCVREPAPGRGPPLPPPAAGGLFASIGRAVGSLMEVPRAGDGEGGGGGGVGGTVCRVRAPGLRKGRWVQLYFHFCSVRQLLGGTRSELMVWLDGAPLMLAPRTDLPFPAALASGGEGGGGAPLALLRFGEGMRGELGPIYVWGAPPGSGVDGPPPPPAQPAAAAPPPQASPTHTALGRPLPLPAELQLEIFAAHARAGAALVAPLVAAAAAGFDEGGAAPPAEGLAELAAPAGGDAADGGASGSLLPPPWAVFHPAATLRAGETAASVDARPPPAADARVSCRSPNVLFGAAPAAGGGLAVLVGCNGVAPFVAGEARGEFFHGGDAASTLLALMEVEECAVAAADRGAPAAPLPPPPPEFTQPYSTASRVVRMLVLALRSAPAEAAAAALYETLPALRLRLAGALGGRCGGGGGALAAGADGSLVPALQTLLVSVADRGPLCGEVVRLFFCWPALFAAADAAAVQLPALRALRQLCQWRRPLVAEALGGAAAPLLADAIVQWWTLLHHGAGEGGRELLQGRRLRGGGVARRGAAARRALPPLPLRLQLLREATNALGLLLGCDGCAEGGGASGGDGAWGAFLWSGGGGGGEAGAPLSREDAAALLNVVVGSAATGPWWSSFPGEVRGFSFHARAPVAFSHGPLPRL